MQPDFTALFRKHTVAPLHFRVRDGASAVHDIQFLSSYLHDARFTANALTRRGKKVTIEMTSTIDSERTANRCAFKPSVPRC